MCRFYLVSNIGALMLGAVACGSANGAVRYSQDFDSLNDGDPVANLPGWSNLAGVVPVKDTAELGKAIDNRASSELGLVTLSFSDPAVNAVPSAGDGLWTTSFDTYVSPTAGFTFAFEVQTNSGSQTPGNPRWVSIDWNNSGSWRTRLWDDDGNLAVDELIASPGGNTAHLVNVALVIDEANGQFYCSFGGTETSKAPFDTDDFDEITTGLFFFNSTTSALVDNILVSTGAVPDLAGDLNSDGFVGQDDLNIVLGNWGQNVTAGDPLMGDPSGDGFVGQDDLNPVLGDWGQGTPLAIASHSAVAEPQSLALLALGIAGFLPLRRLRRKRVNGVQPVAGVAGAFWH